MPNFFSDDIAIYHAYAAGILSGQVPYRDFIPEYPPLALLFFLIPKLLVRDPNYYAVAFQVELALLGLLGLWLALRLRPTLATGFIYAGGFLALMTLTLGRYDVIPAVLTLAAAYLLLTGHKRSAYVVLAIAALTKVYPLVLFPAFIAKERDAREAVRCVGVFALTGIIGVLPFFLLSPSGFIGFLIYQGAREVQIESAANLLFLPLHWLFAYPVEVVYGHQSYGVHLPGDAIWRGGQTILLAAVPLLAYWRARQTSYNVLMEDIVFTLIAFLLANRVFSPQFLIWLAPFLPFVEPRISIAIVSLNLLTEWFYQRYEQVIELAFFENFLVWLRNLGLVIVWYVLLRTQSQLRSRMIIADTHNEAVLSKSIRANVEG